MPTDREIVVEKWPDAFLAIHECDEGCKHYRILRHRHILGMYQNTESEAWADAARRIREAENEKG